jgi:hypothetical protein
MTVEKFLRRLRGEEDDAAVEATEVLPLTLKNKRSGFTPSTKETGGHSCPPLVALP